MATTKTTKKPTVKKAPAVKTEKVAAPKSAKTVLYTSPVEKVLVSPRITEKATQVAENNVYTFNVVPSATKIQVKEAIIALYKVTPIKVNIMKIRARKVFVRGKRGTEAGGRKAYVYLKKGDKIELM
jgi:large subunit ribosomal protein L23